MNILHAGVMSELAIGVIRQLEAESESAKNLGLPWTIRFFTDRELEYDFVVRSPVSSKNRTYFKMSYYYWLLRNYKKYDLLVLRYSVHDPFQLFFVMWCSRPICFVHHTIEVPELLLSQRRLSKVKAKVESIFGSISLSLVDGIIAVTPEMLKYEMSRRLVKSPKPTYVYSNGITYEEIFAKGQVGVSTAEYAFSRRSSDYPPVMLFLSSHFQTWQGLEELLEAAQSFKKDFICHVVGNLTDVQKNLVLQDDRFRVHGSLVLNEIKRLVEESDIGLDGLALSKKNMSYGSTLKAREYLMQGLAVYAGHKDVFPTTFEYYKNGDIDLECISEFALSSRSNDRSRVSRESRPYIDKEIMLENLHVFLDDNFKPIAVE